MKKLFSLALLLLLSGFFLYQNHSDSLFEEIELEGEEEEGGMSKMERENKYFEMEFLMTRDPATNMVHRERLLRAEKIAAAKLAQASNRAIPIQWEERGPDDEGGRTRALLIDANDPTHETVFAGSVSGGLWKTTNISSNDPQWVPINEFFSVLTISYIVQDPTNPNNMYFGTGEGYGNGDSGRGLGIWKSTDGGDNWNQLQSTNNASFRYNRKLAFNDQGHLYVCTNSGLKKSLDGGSTWTTLSVDNSATSAVDIEIASNGHLYCTFTNIGVYKSTDDGANWTVLTIGTNGLPDSGFRRMEVASAPSNPNRVYVFMADTGSGLLGFYRSDDGGNSWILASDSPNLCSTQCWYDMAIIVDPNNPDRLYAGGVSLYASADGASTWKRVNGVHSDHHIVIYQTGSSDIALFGNDGGVYRSTNAAASTPTLLDKNKGYNTVQYYACDLGPGRDIEQFIGGTQDNGTHQFLSAGLNRVDKVAGGDGGYCHIDQDNPDIQIGSYQNNFHYVTTTGWRNGFASSFSVDRGYFISPSGYDSDNNTLYISTSSADYAYVSGIGENNGNNDVKYIDFPFQFGLASTFHISKTTPNRVYMGSSGGELVRVDNPNSDNPTAVLLGDVNRFISSIDIAADNPDHIMMTSTNYGSISVWESFDGGMNFNSVEGDLPDMPVRYGIFSPQNSDQAIIATELGIWTTEDLNGTNTIWQPSANGLANVRVTMLKYREDDGFLLASTYGRGMYTTNHFKFQDTDPPIPTLSSTNTLYSGTFTANLGFNENVTGLTLSDLVISNGAASNLTGAGRSYSFTITPIANGVVTIQLPAATVKDNADIDNVSSNILEVLIDPDANKADLELTLTVDNNNLQIYQNRVYTLTLSNKGGVAATGIEVDFPLPTGLAFVDQNLPSYVYSNWNGLWNVGSMASGETRVLELTAFTLVGTGSLTSYAQVNKSDTDDKDSSPGNGLCCTPLEDDEAAVTLGDTPIDIIPPEVTLSTAASTVSSAFVVNIDFTEDVLGLSLSDFTVSNGVASNLLSPNFSSSYTISITPQSAGTVSIQLPANTVADLAGNDNNASNILQVTHDPSDLTPPDVTLSTPSTTVNALFPITVQASEEITGLTIDDFIFVNCSASSLTSGAPNTYTLSGVPGAAGPMSIQLPAGVATDLAGNGNNASNILNLTFVPFIGDKTDLELSLSLDNTSLSIYQNRTYTLTLLNNSNKTAENIIIDFPTPNNMAYVSQAESQGLYFNWTGEWTVGSLDGGQSATLTLTLFTLQGTGTVTAYAQVTSASPLDIDSSPGNGTCCTPVEDDEAAAILGDVLDNTPPMVTLSTPNTNVSGAFIVTATFSESVTGLNTSDFTISNGGATALSGSGASYSLTVNPTAAGAVSITLPAYKVADAAGNGNLASNILSVTYSPVVNNCVNTNTDFQDGLNTWNNFGKTVLLTSGGYNDCCAAQVGPTEGGFGQSATTEVAASENIRLQANAKVSGNLDWGGFGIRFLDANDNNLGEDRAEVTSSGYAPYTLITKPPAGTKKVYAWAYKFGSEGYLTIDDFCLSKVSGETPPSVSVTGSPTSSGGSFTVGVTFNEAITGLTADDFDVENGNAFGLTGSGSYYSLTVAPINNLRDVRIELKAGKAFDSAGLGNNASNILWIESIVGNGVDLEMNATVTPASFGIYQNITYTISISNTGTIAANSATVELKKAADLAYVSHVVSGGDYNDWLAIWNVGSIAAGETKVLELTLFTLQNSSPITLFTQVTAQSPSDLDSTPDNNSGLVPSEDDEAAITISPSSNFNVGAAAPAEVEEGNFTLPVHIHNLYPNPATEVLKLQIISNSRKKQAIEVYSAQGQLVDKVWIDLEVGYNEHVLPVSRLKSGMYYLLLEGSNRRNTLNRFIKQQR